jgi:hypothetical protein
MKTRDYYAAEAERLADKANHYTYGDGADVATGAALAAEGLVHATLATIAPAEAQAVPVALSTRLRELHYEVDGAPDREGSCLADGADWPCPTMTALFAAEAGESR